MRIRNSRPPFPPPNSLHFGDCFLVQETNRQFGWSCYPLKIPAASAHLNTVGTTGSHTNNKSYCMQEKSSQAEGGQHEMQANEADEGNENLDGNTSSCAVICDVEKPLACSELGYKTEKQTNQLEKKMERDKRKDAIPEKMMELRNISERNIEDKNGSKRIRTLCCPMNCEFFIPPDNEGFEGHRMQEETSLEDTVADIKENPRRGRKSKEVDRSGDANWSIEMCMGYQASKIGRLSNRGEHTANGNNGCMEIKLWKRGRPKRMRTRGRPRKTNNISINEMENYENLEGEGWGR